MSDLPSFPPPYEPPGFFWVVTRIVAGVLAGLLIPAMFVSDRYFPWVISIICGVAFGWCLYALRDLRKDAARAREIDDWITAHLKDREAP